MKSRAGQLVHIWTLSEPDSDGYQMYSCPACGAVAYSKRRVPALGGCVVKGGPQDLRRKKNPSTLAKGTWVRMSEKLKAAFIKKCVGGVHVGPFDPGDANDPGGDCDGCSTAHVEEFGNCTGLVEGPADYNNCKPGDPGYDPSKLGPEVEVRWKPSNLRYAYHPDGLEKV